MTIANVTLTNTFDEWRVRTNQLISLYDETNQLSRIAYNATNNFVSTTANLTANIITSNTTVYNTIYNNANTIAFEVSANLANIIAANTTVQKAVNDSSNTIFNNYLANNNLAYGGAVSNAAFAQANTANIRSILSYNAANAAFNQANTGDITGTSAFNAANAAFVQANTTNATAIAAYGQANTTNILAIAAFTAANNAGAKVAINDEDTNTARYITFIGTNTGNAESLNVSSSKLTFNPNTGTLSATIFNSTSDITQKRDIIEIRSPLFMVRQMHGVGFSWLDTGRKSYGVIAQELEKVLPELVEETNGIKSVNYSGIIAFLIEAIKELDQKIENQ